MAERFFKQSDFSLSNPIAKPSNKAEIILRGRTAQASAGKHLLMLCKGANEMRSVYETVLTAQLAGIEKMRAGVSGREIDKAARDVIAAAGYGPYFGHAFGHALGIDVHESPVASPFSDSVIPEGAVISAEPGIYLPGKFGVRIEDILLITADGSMNLTHMDKNLIVL